MSSAPPPFSCSTRAASAPRPWERTNVNVALHAEAWRPSTRMRAYASFALEHLAQHLTNSEASGSRAHSRPVRIFPDQVDICAGLARDGYASVTAHASGQTVSSLGFPDVGFAVADSFA